MKPDTFLPLTKAYWDYRRMRTEANRKKLMLAAKWHVKFEPHDVERVIEILMEVV